VVGIRYPCSVCVCVATEEYRGGLRASPSPLCSSSFPFASSNQQSSYFTYLHHHHPPLYRHSDYTLSVHHHHHHHHQHQEHQEQIWVSLTPPPHRHRHRHRHRRCRRRRTVRSNHHTSLSPPRSPNQGEFFIPSSCPCPHHHLLHHLPLLMLIKITFTDLITPIPPDRYYYPSLLPP
jgi:hypothetical protein